MEDVEAFSDEMSDEASPEPEELSLIALTTSASDLFTAAVERGEDAARHGRDFAGWCLVCWWVEKAFRESGQVSRSMRFENSVSELKLRKAPAVVLATRRQLRSAATKSIVLLKFLEATRSQA